MYYTNHWVIDWDKVQTLEDLKRLLSILELSFDHNVDVSRIQDMVRLEPKPQPTMSML